jgi:hypothetical protein
MPTLPLNVRLTFAQKTSLATLYYECTGCGRKTKTYRKIKQYLQRCAKED